jgi:hypothetical protein
MSDIADPRDFDTPQTRNASVETDEVVLTNPNTEAFSELDDATLDAEIERLDAEQDAGDDANTVEFSIETAVETALAATELQLDDNLSQLRLALAELSAALGVSEPSDFGERAAS